MLRELGDTVRVASTLFSLGECHEGDDRDEEALGYYEAAVRLDEELGDRRNLALSTVSQARIYSNLGQHERALELGERVFSIHLEKALGYYERALPRIEQTGDRAHVARILKSLGALHDDLGRPGQALGFCEQALAVFVELGDEQRELALLSQMAQSYRGQGRLADALRAFRRLVELDRLLKPERLARDSAALQALESLLNGKASE